MVRVLLVGYDPEAVDYSDPALPSGMNAEKIRAGCIHGEPSSTAALATELLPLSVERQAEMPPSACTRAKRESAGLSRSCSGRVLGSTLTYLRMSRDQRVSGPCETN